MGNLIFGTSETKNIDYSYLDNLSKKKLFEYIKMLNPQNINLPSETDEMTNLMKNMELENTELIPMCIELYNKMSILFSKYPKQIPKSTEIQSKKMYFVKPKFGIDSIKESVLISSIRLHNILFDMSLIKFKNSFVSMKMDNITIEEFNDSFNNNITLKKDMLGINKKMLKYMPIYLKTRFVNTYNNIIKNISCVNKLSIGKASYIYKMPKHGPTNDINSFRQIISIPNALNHFHRILTLRLNNFMQINKYIDTTIQKGGISGQKFAIFEQFYKIKNVIKHANIKKKSCAILFLDISNAFGNINLPSLYKILEIYNVDPNYIAYVKEFYSNFQYYVNNEGLIDETFNWSNGLIQGCAMSPLLFVSVLNYILMYIDKEYKYIYGYDFAGNIRMLLTAYIDDICITCKNTNTLEIVYKKLKEVFEMIGLPINKSKSAIMLVNDNTMSEELSEFTKVNVFKYLGEYISVDGTYTESYIQFLKIVSRRLKMIDETKNISNDDKLKLFNKCILVWIQRKTLAMYDISVTNRLKIISIIKPYLDKWGYNDALNIFSTVIPILNNSNDDIITNIKFQNDEIDEELEQNIEIANYIFKNSDIKLDYSQINDDFQLEIELTKFNELVNE